MRRFLAFVCALACAVLVFSLASCGGEVPTGLEASSSDTDLAARATPALHSATGQATTWYVGPSGSEGWLHISLSARQTRDGSASGNFHWQWRSREPGGRIFVKVSCLTVVGNEAWMVGQASQAENPDNIGKWMGLYVQDNGEGRRATPDRIAQSWIGPNPQGAQEFCTGTPEDLPRTRAVEIGNIQVR